MRHNYEIAVWGRGGGKGEGGISHAESLKEKVLPLRPCPGTAKTLLAFTSPHTHSRTPLTPSLVCSCVCVSLSVSVIVDCLWLISLFYTNPIKGKSGVLVRNSPSLRLLGLKKKSYKLYST